MDSIYEKKVIYRLNDDILFRKCTLFDGSNANHGDCTNFQKEEENWKKLYCCQQDGIHFHCTNHPDIEMERIHSYGNTVLLCPKCKKNVDVANFHDLVSECLRMLNIELFKNAELIRIDDWYVHEVKDKVKLESGYWISTNVKTDKDGDTMVVVYVGHKENDQKAQFFIKPEKLQLTSDHKDMDPSKVLSKIEVTLKNRTLSQHYDK